MKREVVQTLLPRLLKRLFTFGLLSAAIFLAFWYGGGLNLWGALLEIAFIPLMDVTFEPGNFREAAFLLNVPLESGGMSQLTFPANQLNSSLVTVVTLLAMWPHRDLKAGLKLTGWCLLFILLYHLFQISIQLYQVRIGPDFANQQKIFWESSTWYLLIENIAAFDKFILRYWGGFPAFGMGWLVFWSLERRKAPPSRAMNGRGKSKSSAKRKA